MENTNIFVIPNNNINLNRYRNKCSFCRFEGHNITRCNNNKLININTYLILLKNTLTLFNNHNRVLSIIDFENYLYNYCSQSVNNAKLLQYVACRFYNTRLRSPIQISINQIILRLFDINIEWLINNEYNFIPFNQNTPIRISHIINGILLNYYSNGIIDNCDNVFTNYEIKMEKYNDDKNVNIEIECSVCYNSSKKTSFVSLNCNHEYCIECTEQFINKKITTCPYCRNKIVNLTCYTEELYNKLHSKKNHV